MSHHDQDVNTGIIQAIGKQDPRYRMTPSNAQALSDELAEQVRTFALTESGDPKSVRVLTGLNGQEPRETSFSGLVIPGEGELLVPVKEAAAALGAAYAWDQATKTLVLSRASSRVTLTLDKSTAVVKNGDAVELAYPPRLVGGQTYIPLLKLAPLLGFDKIVEQPNAWSYRYTFVGQQTAR